MSMARTAIATKTEPLSITRKWPSLLLIKLGRITLHRFTDALAPLGLKPRHVAALIELRDSGPLTQQALVERLHLDPTNVVAVLNELERNGLAERRRDPEDRRRHIVEASPKARATLDKAEHAMDKAEAELFDALDDGERVLLEELLTTAWHGSGGIEAYHEAAAADPDPTELPKT
ncbi:MAG: MarR family transcriptional regulator, transcriptional regulator for hemolysin [Solirubrobacterales bacterium]|jgi:DNA-binding MarR family transcriptional regulator|nr:MarR family transcriptional regulator, transcriptional regulator for hemolysin [Solirubrobacterales bacterium]